MLSGSFVSATTGIGTTTLPTVFLLIFLIYDTHMYYGNCHTQKSASQSPLFYTHISVLCCAHTGTRKKSNTVITRTCFPSDRCALGQPVGGAVQETAVTIAVTVSCVCVCSQRKATVCVVICVSLTTVLIPSSLTTCCPGNHWLRSNDRQQQQQCLSLRRCQVRLLYDGCV